MVSKILKSPVAVDEEKELWERGRQTEDSRRRA